MWEREKSDDSMAVTCGGRGLVVGGGGSVTRAERTVHCKKERGSLKNEMKEDVGREGWMSRECVCRVAV